MLGTTNRRQEKARDRRVHLLGIYSIYARPGNGSGSSINPRTRIPWKRCQSATPVPSVHAELLREALVVIDAHDRVRRLRHVVRGFLEPEKQEKKQAGKQASTVRLRGGYEHVDVTHASGQTTETVRYTVGSARHAALSSWTPPKLARTGMAFVALGGRASIATLYRTGREENHKRREAPQ